MRMLGAVAAVAALIVDQATKAWAISALWPPQSPGIGLLPVLDLRLTFNSGISFGPLAESSSGIAWLMVAAILGVVGCLIYWLVTAQSRLQALGLGLVVGGAAGNIADWLRGGAATDFIAVNYQGWSWPTLSIADISAVCGIAVIVLVTLNAHLPASCLRARRQ